MENASKALLIAGAVLIAILLIAVGMMIYNGSSGLFGQATSTMSEQEKQAFNQKFEIYEGSMSGTQIKSLIKVVNLNNTNTENAQVTISGTSIKNASDDTKTDFSFLGKTTNMYTVSITPEQGIVRSIKVE